MACRLDGAKPLSEPKAEILLIGPLGTNFSEILIEIYIFSSMKIHLKLSSGIWRPFCFGLNVLKKTEPFTGINCGRKSSIQRDPIGRWRASHLYNSSSSNGNWSWVVQRLCYRLLIEIRNKKAILSIKEVQKEQCFHHFLVASLLNTPSY